MTDASLLLHGAALVLPDVDSRAPLPIGAVLIEGSRIVAVARHAAGIAALKDRAGETIDLTGRVLMPGLVNAHYHSYANVLRGTENSLPLEQWALYTVAYGRSLGDEAIRISILIGAAEMLRAGVTGLIDHFPHGGRADAALDAHRRSGLRVAFAPFLHDLHDHDILGVSLPDDLRRRVEGAGRPDADALATLYRRLKADWHGRDGRLSLLIGPNAPQRCTPALWALWRRLAQELDLGVHTHLLETRPQAGAGQKRWPDGMVAAMADHGLLNERLSVAHAIWTTAEDRKILADHGVTVVHNPASNLMLGSGYAALADYMSRGVPLALGSDCANTGGRHDAFEIMRLAMMLHRPNIADPAAWPSARDALRFATEGGARVLGMAHELGRIEPGRRADLTVLDTHSAAMAALVPNLTAIVQQAGPESVSAVMVDGRWAYREGRILAFDEGAALTRFATLREEINAAARDEVATADEAAALFAGLADGGLRF